MSMYVIWWTNQTDCELIQAICEVERGGASLPGGEAVPEGWPGWLSGTWRDRWGRNAQGRLWNRWTAGFSDGVNPWPDNRLTKLLGGDGSDGRHSAAGIVLPLGDLHHVIGLPGFVTNDTVTRLWVHGVDVDL